MKKSNQVVIAIESWREEKQSAHLYLITAQQESSERYKKLFQQLAEEAEKQAILWENEIQKSGGKTPAFRPNLRTKVTGFLIRKLGPRSMRPILAAMKVRGMSVYSKSEPGHPMPKTLADVGHRHKVLGNSNNLRAAVFGINDGLVSNASLILGMAGADSSTKIIILAGIAGLLAGACSMGAGEFISVRSQREMFEYQIDLEKKELELYPEQEKEELALIYEARGLPLEEARRVANTLMSNQDKALDVLAREELGVNPEDLVSPYGAAIFSFLFFSIGAAIPLIPFFFNTRTSTLPTSIVLTGLSLFIVGAVMSLFTGRSAWFSGLRMLAIGALAGIITYGIGNWLGVQLH